MAGAGAKKRLEESARRLKSLRIAILTGITVHVVLRLIIHRSLFAGFWSGTLVIISAAVSWLCYSAIAAFATPVYSDNGELIDGGADLNMKGMCGHYHDVLYVTIFAQAASGLSGWFWLSYLLVPGYGLYLAWIHILKPYFFNGSSGNANGELNESERKKAERTQERAERRRQKSMSKW